MADNTLQNGTANMATEEARSGKDVAAEADKARANAERDRKAAKREAMKPASQEAIDAARLSIAVKGW